VKTRGEADDLEAERADDPEAEQADDRTARC